MAAEKTHTTNYFDTFIEVAEDTKVSSATIPASRGGTKTVAEWQYEIVSKNPYKYTSDEIFFLVFAKRSELLPAEYEEARKVFFSKGQPCFRASPLTKTYGFGVHSDQKGRVALYGMETEQYEKFVNDPKITKVKAMRTSKK